MKETWQEQSVEMTSVSVQNAVSPHQQNLKMSRMSAGFADISQLADEEKEQLDQLIERLDEERRRVAATTQLLSSARSPPIQNRPSSGESERQRLKDELKNVREYNRELERELEDIRFDLHSDNHSHASTPHGGAISPIHTTERPHSSPGYYHPHDTIPKQAYAEHFKNAPQGTIHPMAPNNSVIPLYTSPEEAGSRSLGGQAPGYPPRVRSQSCETGATNSYRSPIKAHPSLNLSSPGNYVMNGEESPMQIHKRGLRSHGNSPSSGCEPQLGEVPHRGSFVPRQLLPDAPFIKMNRQPQSVSPASSMRSGKSQFSRHGGSAKIFDGASPEMMFKSLNTSSTASDRRNKSNPAVSSHDTMTQHRLSPALQQAYQRHLEATGQAGGSDKSWHSCSQKSTSRKSSRRNSKDYETDSLSDDARSTPKFRNSREQPLIDLASSANISSDSLGSQHHKFKPVTMETQLFPVETGNSLHSLKQGASPVDHRSRSSTPKISNISAYVKEPGDLMGSYGSAGFPQRVSSPASVSSRNSRPKSRHSRSRTSTPKIADLTTSTGPKQSLDSFSSGVTPRTRTPASHKPRSQTSTPKIAGPIVNMGPKKFVDSFGSGVTPNDSTSTSHKSRSRTSTPKVTDTSTSDIDPPFVVKRDSHGSFVPPRRVLSQENLNFRSHPTKSVDSDSLHTPSPNHSIGFSAADSSDAEVQRISHPTYLKQFDPYSSLYASDHDEKVAYNQNNPLKSAPTQGIASSSSSTQKTSSTITPSNHSFVSNAGYEMEQKAPHDAKHTSKQYPTIDANTHSSMSGTGSKMNQKFLHKAKHGGKKQIPNSDPSVHSSMSDTGVKMHKSSQNLSSNSGSTQEPSTSTINSCDHSSVSDIGSRKKKGPRPVKPQRNSSKQHLHSTDTSKPHSRPRSNTSPKRNSSANSSRRSTPKIEKRKSESSSDEENVKKEVKNQKSDVHTSSKSSDGSRSTPDGDIEKEFQRSEDEHRFESPEEEMKFLISKLQKLMPSMFDENTDPEKCSPVEKKHPMSEVLVAAEQTRKAIELFTDYAIAASAGEGTFL